MSPSPGKPRKFDPLAAMRAAEKKNLVALQAAIEKTPELHILRMALSTCAVRGFTEGAALLAPLCPSDIIAQSLYQAAGNGHADTLRVLVHSTNADVDCTDALVAATASRNPDCVAMLVPRANPDKAASDLLDDQHDAVDLLAAHLSATTLRVVAEDFQPDDIPAITARLRALDQATALDAATPRTAPGMKGSRL